MNPSGGSLRHLLPRWRMKFLGRSFCKADTTATTMICLDRDTLSLDLLNPLLRALFGHIRLIVLVECAPHKVITTDRLRLLVLVALRRPRPYDLRALLLEAGLELVHRVAVVVRIPRLIAHAEDRDLLPVQVKAGEVSVEELIPRRAAALRVRPGVPRRRSNDEAVTLLDCIE